MEYPGRERPVRIVNTEGCCFFCLYNGMSDIEDGENAKDKNGRKSSSHLMPLQVLLRHLQIKEALIAISKEENSSNTSFLETVKAEEIFVHLCNSCKTDADRFTVLCKQLENIQMEINQFLENIHQSIFQSRNNSDLLKNYSVKLERKNGGMFSSFTLVENLRKEVANKCFERQAAQHSSNNKTNETVTRTNEEHFEVDDILKVKSKDAGNKFYEITTEMENYALPEKQCKILQSYVSSQECVEWLQGSVLKGVKSFLIDSGEMKRNSHTCYELLEHLSSEKAEIMLARIGLIMRETYLYDEKNVESKLENNLAEDDFTKRNPATNEAGSLPNANLATLSIKPESECIEASDRESSIPKVESWIDLSIKDSVLESAYEAILQKDGFTGEEKSRRHAVMKAGQILFQGVFTQQEINDCNISGRKNYKPFQKEKLRLITKTIAWLLKQPRNRTMEQLRKAEKKCDLILDKEGENTLQKCVFIEFANHLRSKTKKINTAGNETKIILRN